MHFNASPEAVPTQERLDASFAMCKILIYHEYNNEWDVMNMKTKS